MQSDVDVGMSWRTEKTNIADLAETRVQDLSTEIVFNCVKPITAILETIDFLILLHTRIDIIFRHYNYSQIFGPQTELVHNQLICYVTLAYELE